MLERVDAVFTVNRRLYQSEDITRFDLGALVANEHWMSWDRAALGLVLNEVLTNAGFWSRVA
jgi:hypothetical protein